MDIKTIGDFRRLTQDLDDDFKIDVRIMREVTEEELKNRSYPYPWDMFDGTVEDLEGLYVIGFRADTENSDADILVIVD